MQARGLDHQWRTTKNENWSCKGENRAILIAVALKLLDKEE